MQGFTAFAWKRQEKMFSVSAGAFRRFFCHVIHSTCEFLTGL
jgi:hypothetical protein